jgi:hypothetical protein
LVNRHNVYVRITYDLLSGVSEEFTVCVFRNLSEDGGSLFLQNSISVKKKWFSFKLHQPIKRMSLIIKAGFLLLSVLSFKVRFHSLTHQ